MTKNAVMCLHYCLDAENTKQAALKFVDRTHQTNWQIKREALPFLMPTVIPMSRVGAEGEEEQHQALKRENKAKNNRRQEMKM